jgi:hypothetical protein
MKYKRQIYTAIVYSIAFVVSCFGFRNTLNPDGRILVTYIYLVTANIISIFIIVNLFNTFLIDTYCENLPKNLGKMYPDIDPIEFDFRIYESNHDPANKYFIKPITCLIILTPYFWYHLTHQYELRIIFGILGNISLVLCFGLAYIISLKNRFLFMRHLDQQLNHPK